MTGTWVLPVAQTSEPGLPTEAGAGPVGGGDRTRQLGDQTAQAGRSGEQIVPAGRSGEQIVPAGRSGEQIVPAEPVPASGGLPLLPPGPRDPVSGPLAIVVDLPAARRSAPSSTLPAVTIDAMVWAAVAESESDELTSTLERLGDPDRGGRHTGASSEVPRPSGLVVVGASTVGDPEARARRGRHTA